MKIPIFKLIIASVIFACINHVAAQGTAFTYQGRLNNDGSPANGSYDLSFTLYNTNASGVAVVGPVTNSAVSVANGLFTTLVDFGAGVFLGTSNWLEIAVSTNGANSFTTLSPRQQVTPTPYAIFANTASNAVMATSVSGSVAADQLVGNISAANIADGTITSNLLSVGSVGAAQLATNIGIWTRSGANIFYTNGNAGIGTNNPTARLHVSSSSPVVMLADGSSTAGTWLDLRNTAAGTNWQIISTGSGNGEGPGKLLFDIGPSPGVVSGNVMTLTPNRKVGIGTANPASPLQVVGSVISGGSANLVASNLIASTIAGGGVPGFPNSVYGESSFIGAGNANTISSNINNSFIGAGFGNSQSSVASFIGAGNLNSIQTNADLSVIGGGNNNVIQPNSSQQVIAGGMNNTIQSLSWASAIGGGGFNVAQGYGATVPGGWSNSATANFTFAGGQNAKATNTGSFVWAGDSATPFASTANNSFNVRATGGVAFVTSGAGLTIDSGNVGIGTSNPQALLQVTGPIRMGSEQTSEAPNRSGLVVRRINSTSAASGQIIAYGGYGGTNIQLQRDGTPGGLILKILANSGGPMIAGFGINASGTTINVYNLYYGGSTGTYQIFTDAQKIGYFRLTFGDTYNAGDSTTVEITRFVDTVGNNTVNMTGTLTSTINQ